MTVQDDFAALQAEVTNNTTVESSAVALIQGLAAQLAAIAAQGTPITSAQIDALATQLKTNDTALAAAVTANTPAPAPTPSPAPAPAPAAAAPSPTPTP